MGKQFAVDAIDDFFNVMAPILAVSWLNLT